LFESACVFFGLLIFYKLFIIYSACSIVWILLYVFVHIIDKKNGTVDIVWSVGLKPRGVEFEP